MPTAVSIGAWRCWPRQTVGSDDFGLAALNAQGRTDLLEVVDARSGGRSTIITSQLPVDKWHDYLGSANPTVADAILDRLTSGAVRLPMRGESMRKVRA